MADDKKTINWVSVDQMTHEWLVQEANKAGQRVGDYAGMLLDRQYLGGDYNHMSSNPLVRARDYLIKHQRLQAAAKDVYQLAAIYLSRPEDTDLADDLAEMCEELGLDMRTVIDTTINTPFLSRVNSTKGKYGQCIEWLSNLLISHPVIASAAIFQMATDTGYSKTMVERSKMYLNNSDTGWIIKSVHNGAAWEWHLEKVQEPQETTTISIPQTQYRTTQAGPAFDE